MKTMNYLFTAVFVLLLGACSSENQPIEEDLAATDFRGRMAQENEEPQKILELDLHKYFIINQLAQLDFEKKQLEEQIDGGRKDLVPKLEFTMKSFADYEKQLIDIHEVICNYLEIIAKSLALKASMGDTKAEDELSKMDESLKACGIEISYRYFELNGIIPPGLGKTKTVGGCQIPGRDFKACDIPLQAGEYIILAEDRLDQLIITTEKGETVAKAELIGKSEVIDGNYEYAFELSSSIGTQLSIGVSKKDVNYNVPVKISEGF